MEKNNNLIAISGKMGSGKNSVATIIQGLNASLDRDVIIHHVRTNKPFSESSGYRQVAIADSLKQVSAFLLSCDRNQLDSQEFKSSFLPEYNMTVREFLQKVGTEFGRSVHKDIWINSLFSEYKPYKETKFTTNPTLKDEEFPKWIITDLRFPNELEAVKQRNGITIRIEREYSTVVDQGNGNWATFSQTQFHPSETSLDYVTDWSYVIENNGTLEDLIKKVKEILIKEKII